MNAHESSHSHSLSLLPAPESPPARSASTPSTLDTPGHARHSTAPNPGTSRSNPESPAPHSSPEPPAHPTPDLPAPLPKKYAPSTAAPPFPWPARNPRSQSA